MLSNSPSRSALAVALVLSSSCSFLTVTAPPPRPIDPTRDVNCSSASGAPGLDLFGGILLGIVGASFGALMSEHGGIDPSDGNSLVVFGPLTVAVLDFASAARGFNSVAACRTVRERIAACREGSAEACAWLKADDTAAWKARPLAR